LSQFVVDDRAVVVAHVSDDDDCCWCFSILLLLFVALWLVFSVIDYWLLLHRMVVIMNLLFLLSQLLCYFLFAGKRHWVILEVWRLTVLISILIWHNIDIVSRVRVGNDVVFEVFWSQLLSLCIIVVAVCCWWSCCCCCRSVFAIVTCCCCLLMLTDDDDDVLK